MCYNLLVGAALAVIAVILLVIGRWRLFRKAGKPGWHSIIPILSMYQEYAISWKGWVGLLSLLCGACSPSDLSPSCCT